MKIRGKRAEVEIPTASQSDIAFLLIIFFLVTASFAVKSGISLGYPKKESLPKEIYVKEIGNIKITKEGFFFNEEKIDENSISQLLEKSEVNKYIIYVEKGVSYERVVKILSYFYNKNLEISLRVQE